MTVDLDTPETLVRRMAEAARAAVDRLAVAKTGTKNAALTGAAKIIRARQADILAANARDIAEAERQGLSSAMRDRLLLNPARVEAMAKGLEDVATLPDPVGQTIAEWTRPNGLKIARVRVPLGVIGVIYESRPNVTADAAALCLKSGNAVILRGGSESLHSSQAVYDCLLAGITAAGLPDAAVQLVPTRDRAAVGAMLKAAGLIDIIVPRGGKSLIERVIADSKIPVIKHLEGICHTYVDGEANLEMARKIVLNAKMRRTGVCGATETLLVDRRAIASHLKPIISDLIAAGCEVRGDETTRSIDREVKPATAADWDTEYLDAIIAVKVVDGVKGAIEHIRKHGSRHTDSIVTDDAAAAATFLNELDSAIVLHNASTQFADGGEFGMGAEIGISTDKLHARGPVGVEQLTSYKYVVRGTGQVRP
ncbi:MAG TPA: glutamate-5-semialdehyde dehydrogenase [Alphaproteobacteria bacterium]|jgi:glutamate-5-semialdehyde dehydrogenase|nr:glutamate-5-semialdehyde dehydrogenase [Alphaproteobacteria bacterium]